MRMRLSKNQKEYQEAVLKNSGLAEFFKPGRILVEQFALEIIEQRKLIEQMRSLLSYYRTKSLWWLFWHREQVRAISLRVQTSKISVDSE